MSLAITAFALGIAYAAVPGAVNTESIRRALHSGFRSGFLIQFGALVGDAAWAIVGLTGAAIFLQSDTIAGVLGLISASLLLWLACQALRGALSPRHDAAHAAGGGSLRVGLAFGVANPAGVAFWSGLGASIFGTTAPDMISLAVLLVFFLAGATTWGAILVQVIAWGGQKAGHRLLPIVDAISAILLGWFGIKWLWTAFQRLRPVVMPMLRVLI